VKEDCPAIRRPECRGQKGNTRFKLNLSGVEKNDARVASGRMTDLIFDLLKVFMNLQIQPFSRQIKNNFTIIPDNNPGFRQIKSEKLLRLI
jgi:hypothetical protein